MNNEKIIEKLLEVSSEFGMLMREMIIDADNESFKMNKFSNRMENFCTESIRKLRGF